MSSRFPRFRCPCTFVALLLCAASGSGVAASATTQSTLRVCADPNNLPFSDRHENGFENRIVRLIGDYLHRAVEYRWWAQRRGFLRNTLSAGECDVVPGIVTGVDAVETTDSYYRSTYVFVSRARKEPGLSSLDSPLLRSARIGVQLIGDDYANTPPVHALAQRGIVHVHGYRVLDDYRQANPPARIIEAVANGEIDIAIAWGPLAGYFAALSRTPLIVTPIISQKKERLPMSYDISMGVRHGEHILRDQLNAALRAKRANIDAILREYHVPRVH